MQVKTSQFEGPLDLLLQLIEQQQMDVSTLSLAKVTEQFLEYIKNLQEKNPTNLADFLVIAAKLLVIKSKSLLPNLELDVEEEETAFDLAEQLLQYKKYKEAAKYLRMLDGRRHQSWGRETDFYDRVTFLPDPEITADVLAGRLRNLASELKEIIKRPQEVMKQVMSISERITHIQRLISTQVQTSLSTLLKDTKNKTEVIVTFLALLELTKQRVLVVEQNEMFSDIIIKKQPTEITAPSET
jgi:segregation and condensation protein A